MQDTIGPGDRVYVATDRAYYGRGTDAQAKARTTIFHR